MNIIKPSLTEPDLIIMNDKDGKLVLYKNEPDLISVNSNDENDLIPNDLLPSTTRNRLIDIIHKLTDELYLHLDSEKFKNTIKNILNEDEIKNLNIANYLINKKG